MSPPPPESTAPRHPIALLAPHPDTASPDAPHGNLKPPRRSRWLYIAIVLVLAAACIYWFRIHKSPGTQNAAANSVKGGKAGAAVVTPVVAVKATTGNIGVYVTGLGAITPIYTVTVKSRVDGQLMSVHFQEGDLVKQGDPLIEIDPRPYQAVVTQVEGQLVRDQALLANARVDLNRYVTLLAQDAIPEQQLATQQALVTQYEGTVKNDEGLLAMRRDSTWFTATSRRRSPESWDCGLWIRVTSFTQPIRTGCW